MRSIPAPSISVSLVSSVTEDGWQSASFVLWKGEFLLKNHMYLTDHINLLLRFPHTSGKYSTEETFKSNFTSVFNDTTNYFRLFKECRVVKRGNAVAGVAGHGTTSLGSCLRQASPASSDAL